VALAINKLLGESNSNPLSGGGEFASLVLREEMLGVLSTIGQIRFAFFFRVFFGGCVYERVRKTSVRAWGWQGFDGRASKNGRKGSIHGWGYSVSLPNISYTLGVV